MARRSTKSIMPTGTTTPRRKKGRPRKSTNTPESGAGIRDIFKTYRAPNVKSGKYFGNLNTGPALHINAKVGWARNDRYDINHKQLVNYNRFHNYNPIKSTALEGTDKFKLLLDKGRVRVYSALHRVKRIVGLKPTNRERDAANLNYYRQNLKTLYSKTAPNSQKSLYEQAIMAHENLYSNNPDYAKSKIQGMTRKKELYNYPLHVPSSSGMDEYPVSHANNPTVTNVMIAKNKMYQGHVNAEHKLYLEKVNPPRSSSVANAGKKRE